jgi:uncharacterized membrane protein
VKLNLNTTKNPNGNSMLNENKGYVVAVAVALILVFSVFVAYYITSRAPPEGYTRIDLLDAQKQAVNYPELVVINQNNTFNVWVEVENHLGKTQAFEILLKVTNDTSPTVPADVQPSNSYTTLENGEKSETYSTVTINQPGFYSVIFELWLHDENTGQNQFSSNACVLNLEAVNQV